MMWPPQLAGASLESEAPTGNDHPPCTLVQPRAYRGRASASLKSEAGVSLR
jgi:hypothetical protein